MGKSAKDRRRAQFPVYKESVVRFFSDSANWDAIWPYLNGEHFSRRFLEHFITDYARTFRCEYYLTDPATNERYLFNVYHSAQAVLLGNHKCHMDPFSRRNRSVENDGFFEFGHGDKRCMVTVGELTFFRWALKKKVLEYALEHRDEIAADMARLAKMKRQRHAEIDEIEIEVPEQALASVEHPLRDRYWQAATSEKMQAPRKKRKRYRDSSVSTIFSGDIVESQNFT